ncbi:hypothetical protein MBLNU13_g03984t1 [Cladosporium sp. NU13]
MADPKELGKCAKCTEPFTKHSPSLSKNVQLQALCARCPEILKQDSGTSVGCDTCSAIIYYSSKCKERNAKEHELFCKIFADVHPRPSEAHRLHILFRAHEDKMRFIWLPNYRDEASRKEALNSEVDPYKWETEGFAAFDESGESENDRYRAVSGYYVKMFIRLLGSDQNRSLGLVVNGRPVSHFRGNVALAASRLTIEDVDLELAPIDALPCDLPKSLQCLAREGLWAGSKIKMELVDFDLDSDDESEGSEEQ